MTSAVAREIEPDAAAHLQHLGERGSGTEIQEADRSHLHG
jgi:hypothetical protein